MARYHFNVKDGSNYPDIDGTELPDLSTAREEAVKLAGRLLLDEPRTFLNGSDWHVEVADTAGRVMFRLLFTAVNGPVPAMA
jgi:hypothetical protein